MGDTAAAAGLTRAAVDRLLKTDRDGAQVRTSTATAVRRAYDALSMTPGGHDQAARLAIAEAWPPPLAWDDESIDDPQAEAHGVRTSAPRSVVDPADVAHFLALGLGRDSIAQRLGVRPETLQTALQRAGRRDLWLEVSDTDQRRRDGATRAA